jgi:tRNA A-37 threonylcarbamoyl transferase component Bud32
VAWQLEPEFVSVLDQVLRDPGRVVKLSPAKRVTYHTVAGRHLYLKRYDNTAVPLRGLKFLFKASHTRREWNQAREIQRRGVPVVRHLAFGERWGLSGLRESLLITEAFDGQPLLEFPGRGKPEVQEALGRFVRQMHDGGVVQFDLAPNILVRAQPLEFCRVDVHHAMLKPAIPEPERLDNLALLHVFLPLQAEFFAGYGGSGDWAGRTWQRSADLRRAFLRRRSRRCLKHNAEFERRRMGPLRWQVRLPWLDPRVEAILREPDRFLATRARLLKRGRSTTVGAADGLVLKRHNPRRLDKQLRDLVRPSKARQSFHKAYHLELAGVPTARPIAVATRRPWGWLRGSYLVLEEIPGARHLGQWEEDPAPAVRGLAALVAKLHNEGFSHRDLKETNLVFDRDQRAFLVDLEGLAYCGVVPRARALADLARLDRAAAALPRLRAEYERTFRSEYCRERGWDPRDWTGPGGAGG